MTDLHYFERAVRASEIFGHKGLAMPTKDNAAQWIERIENELSPENLTCDGELPRNQVAVRSRTLHAALAYCQSILGTQPNRGYGFTGFGRNSDPFETRTAYRKGRLDAAVQNGFTVGARVMLSNGTSGVIVKVNRTRVKVEGDDKRMWSVPPGCMKLI